MKSKNQEYDVFRADRAQFVQKRTRVQLYTINFLLAWEEKKERKKERRKERKKKKEQNCDLPSCRFATLAKLSGRVSDLVGQHNA